MTCVSMHARARVCICMRVRARAWLCVCIGGEWGEELVRARACVCTSARDSCFKVPSFY